MIRFKIILCTLASFFSCLQAESLRVTPALHRLLNDMKLYKLDSKGEPHGHAGDLYEHSVWTYNAMLELLENNSPYQVGLVLSQRQKEIVVLAALLHDIGKAGRRELFKGMHPTLQYNIIKNDQGRVEQIHYYSDYQEHTCVGFEYASKHLVTPKNKAKQKKYHLVDPTTGILIPFSMKKMFNELTLTIEEQKILAILIGMHYEFGILKHDKITIEQFFSILENLVTLVDYNQGKIDTYILHLSILINVADVKGSLPVQASRDSLFLGKITCQAPHTNLIHEDPFVAFGYECNDGSVPIAITTMKNIFDYFYGVYQSKN